MRRMLSLETRYALYVMGGRKCVWCGRPISFREMEADHLIPKPLTGDDLQRVLALHSLPPDYDIEAVRNRAPACRECNGKKSSRIPPDAPIITMVLESAASRAPAVERRAKAALSRRDVEDALVRIELVLREEPDDEAQSLLKELAERMTRAASRVATPDSEVTFEMHPALALLWNPGTRWRLVQSLEHLALVEDGTESGIVGNDITYECGHCGNYGPWSGARCLTCGQLSEPWD
jgi:hypothetical protein